MMPQPKLVETSGDECGLRRSTPGTPRPHELYGLVGAGVDGRGNTYVACCLAPSARGTAIKAFDSTGEPLWDVGILSEEQRRDALRFCRGHSGLWPTNRSGRQGGAIE